MLFFGAGLLVPLGMGDADTGFCYEQRKEKPLVRLENGLTLGKTHFWSALGQGLPGSHETLVTILGWR